MWSRNYRVLWLSEHSPLSLHNSDIVPYPELVKSSVEPSIPLTSYIPNIYCNITSSSTCKSLKWTLPNKCFRQIRCSPWTEEMFEGVLYNSLITFFCHSDIWWKSHLWISVLSFPSVHSLLPPSVRPRYYLRQFINLFLIIPIPCSERLSLIRVWNTKWNCNFVGPL